MRVGGRLLRVGGAKSDVQVRIAGVRHRFRVRMAPLDHAIGEPVIGGLGRLGIFEIAQPVQIGLDFLGCGLTEQG